jgi:16S rRNA (uracil1498-N3)-methyltransferase
VTQLIKDTFYCPPSGITGDAIVIGGDEFSHLAHVMRKREGDALMVVDGKGTAYEAVISAIEKRSARCAIVKRHSGYHEPAVGVTLGVGILKNPSKFDFIVEKATELGVSVVVPLLTERTIPGPGKGDRKSDRWRKLALAAMKQCGRSLWPEVRELTPLGTLLKDSGPYGMKLVAHERLTGDGGGMPAAGGLTPPVKSVLILVGPEGGFSDGEVALCREAGFETVYLGERRLRTETAAIASLALVMR